VTGPRERYWHCMHSQTTVSGSTASVHAEYAPVHAVARTQAQLRSASQPAGTASQVKLWLGPTGVRTTQICVAVSHFSVPHPIVATASGAGASAGESAGEASAGAGASKVLAVPEHATVATAMTPQTIAVEIVDIIQGATRQAARRRHPVAAPRRTRSET